VSYIVTKKRSAVGSDAEAEAEAEAEAARFELGALADMCVCMSDTSVHNVYWGKKYGVAYTLITLEGQN
jgi:hypothetical protein